ncbi:helix-turn-helix transcriptional regulator [Paenibacillus piri]|uniref:YafY family transcriptional regulator n=1 Tax=Paenibacillus piri TaxID=2547395 RepID=A0A4V2ZTQ7_9BACL|nr:YafY family protein [Paenibacillus piri]TDF98004.1 YafY family transcriptional regulator [Paenibacillus piri]
MSKSTNMLSILWLLRAGRRKTAQQLADELEIHIRTVYRCIDSLCASGVPIIADSGPNGGYRILDHFTESPLLFDMEEQKALVQAAAFAQEAGYPFKEALTRAVDKIKRYTNEEQLDRIERHMDGFSVIHPPVEGRQQELLQVLEEAAAQGQSVKMEYDKGRGEAPSIRVFDPYGIVHWKGAWYTVGFCCLRGQLRSFRTDRIVRLEETERRFERPNDFSAKAHLMRELLPDALDAESLTLVRIQAHEHVLDLLNQHWLFGHALVECDNGQAVYRIGMPSVLTYVPYFLLPYGKALTILEPDMLVERLADICGVLTEHYRSMKSGLNP